MVQGRGRKYKGGGGGRRYKREVHMLDKSLSMQTRYTAMPTLDIGLDHTTLDPLLETRHLNIATTLSLDLKLMF